MAVEDYVVADRAAWVGTGNVTASKRIAQTVQATPDAESAAAATAADVSNPAYIAYATALATHEARDDIEPLAARRKREVGTVFTDAAFMRNRADGVAPTPGTVNGKAPKP